MVRSIYVFSLSPFRPPKGPFMKDVCKIFGMLDPLPLRLHFQYCLSTKLDDFWTPSPFGAYYLMDGLLA